MARNHLAACRDAERAVEDLDFAVGQPAPQAAKLLVIRAACLADRGRHQEAAAAAAKLAELIPASPGQVYNAACIYALCVAAVAPGKTLEQFTPEQRELQGRYTNQALDALSRAMDLGFNNLNHLQIDPDLAALRRHPGYLALVKRLRNGP
jgi:hypothetical protein